MEPDNENNDHDFAALAVLLFESDSSDSEEDDGIEDGRVHVDMDEYRRLDGRAFREHFRMSRPTFEKLILLLGNHLTVNNRLQRIRTPLDTCLLMTLWMLANADTFRSCASRFAVNKSVVFFHYAYIIEALRELAPQFIQWPSVIERDVVKVAFEEKYGYPGVIGCIDGTHVTVTAPLEQPQQYVKRHYQYSILVQAVSDHNFVYRDVFIGQPGSVGDARMFARSPLSDNLLRRPDLIGNDEHLLGDGAYTLTKHVMIPYVNDGQLTPRQRRHNYILSSARSTVERSFALLKGKWRRLKLFPSYSLAIAIDHITACLVLHNFVLLDGNECNGMPRNREHVHVHAAAPEALVEEARNEGIQKREYIAAMLHPAEE